MSAAPSKGRVLIADDSRFFLQSLERLLQSEGYEVISAEDGHQAVVAACEHTPDLVLMDVEMPRVTGIEACRKLKTIPETVHIPVLFVTSNASSDVRLKGLKAGGEEFLTKPFIPEEILAQVDKFMKRVQSTLGLMDKVKLLEDERNDLQKRLGSGAAEEKILRGFPITPSNSLAVISDIDDRLIAFARDNRQFVLLYLAVDNMDRVDMLYGSEIVFEAQAFIFNKTVEYLREVSADLDAVRIARNLADDVVIFLPDKLLADLKIDSANVDEFGLDLLKHVRFGMESQFMKKEVAPILNISTGLSWVTTSSRLSFNRQILNAIRDASSSAYNFQGRARQRLHNRLREMIQNRAMKIMYQPLVRAVDFRIAAYEALARGEFPELERPQLMFDVAEESRQVHALSRLCREKAIESLPSLDAGKLMFVNFHPDDFNDPHFLMDSPDEPIFKADPKRIVIEMTERAAIKDAEQLREVIEFLKKKGFRIAIDDLGSGYTSLGLIASLEPDYIKFDMSLIRGIERSPTKQALLKTLAQFTQDIGATSVAEGIETQEELDVVREFRCDLCQGYYFAKPQAQLITEADFAFTKSD
ncbi:EAL domain-containing response regulator [bacterium]|nr:EAL domain-containing response regulator [bacterium]